MNDVGAVVGGLLLIAFALASLVSALLGIWLVDGRWAATSGVMLVCAFVTLVVGAVLWGQE